MASCRSVEASDGEASEETDGEKPRRRKPSPRFHFLDWFRVWLVLAVVAAHLTQVSWKVEGGFEGQWLIDSRTLWDHKSYREILQANVTEAEYGGLPRGLSPYWVRWTSVNRQWAVPGLFWTSGAAAACSYRGGMPRGLGKLAGFAVLGMSSNAVLWFGSSHFRWVWRKRLNDLHLEDQAAWLVAIVFHMWFVLLLMVFLLVSWPLFTLVNGSGKFGALGLHFVSTMTVIALLVLAPAQGGEHVPQPFLKLMELTGLEVVFTVLLALEAPLLGRPRQLAWLPVRAVHYLMAIVVVMQFGLVPYSDGRMKSVGPSYTAYVVTGFLRFFHLGFIMQSARLGSDGDRARPIASRAWPFAMGVVMFFMPSTNWDLAGMLTYPYFSDWFDRCDYIAGAVIILFFVDRVSRGVEASPVPSMINYGSLLTYLFHPLLLSAFLATGARWGFGIWVLTGATGPLIAFVSMRIHALIKGPSSDHRHSSGSSDDSELEKSMVDST